MIELPPKVVNDPAETAVKDQVKPSNSYENRTVTYWERPESYAPNTGWTKTIRSTEISKVRNPQLRCALRIADIMQALNFPKPEFGPMGGVTAIQKPVPNVSFTRFYVSEAIDAFPDDVMSQIAERGTVSDS